MRDTPDAVDVGQDFLRRMAELEEPPAFASFGRHASGSRCFVVRYGGLDFYFDIGFRKVRV